MIGMSGSGFGWSYQPSERGVKPKSAFAPAMYGGAKLFRIEVTGENWPRYPKVKRINTEFIVPYWGSSLRPLPPN
ncbi:MAG: hypothetical protein AB4042_11730 [Leptolyngbyaceae cyanobacterium]